jgi:hypothetical protein
MPSVACWHCSQLGQWLSMECHPFSVLCSTSLSLRFSSFRLGVDPDQSAIICKSTMNCRIAARQTMVHLLQNHVFLHIPGSGKWSLHLRGSSIVGQQMQYCYEHCQRESIWPSSASSKISDRPLNPRTDKHRETNASLPHPKSRENDGDFRW